MKFTKLICILLTVFTVLSLASCADNKNGGSSTEGSTTPEATTPAVTTPESSNKDTEPVGSSSESDTDPVTPPASSSESDTQPEENPADTYVIPADGKIKLGDGANGISYPFAAGVLTGLTGELAVAAMGKLDQAKWFTKVVTPIGGFVGNWQLTEDSTLNQFTAGNYGDIQMFYHTSESNWVFGPDGGKGQVIIIKFTAPADGTYSYTVTGRDWASTSDGAVMDVHIGENMHNWWDLLRFAGTGHNSYAGQQTSSEKALAAGTNVYFIIRRNSDMTVTAISEFTINYTPAA